MWAAACSSESLIADCPHLSRPLYDLDLHQCKHWALVQRAHLAPCCCRSLAGLALVGGALGGTLAACLGCDATAVLQHHMVCGHTQAGLCMHVRRLYSRNVLPALWLGMLPINASTCRPSLGLAAVVVGWLVVVGVGVLCVLAIKQTPILAVPSRCCGPCTLWRQWCQAVLSSDDHVMPLRSTFAMRAWPALCRVVCRPHSTAPTWPCRLNGRITWP